MASEKEIEEVVKGSRCGGRVMKELEILKKLGAAAAREDVPLTGCAAAFRAAFRRRLKRISADP